MHLPANKGYKVPVTVFDKFSRRKVSNTDEADNFKFTVVVLCVEDWRKEQLIKELRTTNFEGLSFGQNKVEQKKNKNKQKIRHVIRYRISESDLCMWNKILIIVVQQGTSNQSQRSMAGRDLFILQDKCVTFKYILWQLLIAIWCVT